MPQNLISRINKIHREQGLSVLTKKIFNSTMSVLSYPYCLIKIKTIKNYNAEKLVDFTFNKCYGLIKPMQIKKEILELMNILKKFQPKNILEIGTARGGTLFLFSHIIPEDASIISIDLPHGEFGGGYPNWKIPLYKSFAMKNQKIHLIRKNSHKKETLKQVKSILKEQKIDFLFIDGDHTCEGVKKDYLIYSPLVKKDGIIAFHDIAIHPQGSGCKVNKFWNEIKKKYNYKEIIDEHDQNWGGIGILYPK